MLCICKYTQIRIWTWLIKLWFKFGKDKKIMGQKYCKNILNIFIKLMTIKGNFSFFLQAEKNYMVTYRWIIIQSCHQRIELEGQVWFICLKMQ